MLQADSRLNVVDDRRSVDVTVHLSLLISSFLPLYQPLQQAVSSLTDCKACCHRSPARPPLVWQYLVQCRPAYARLIRGKIESECSTTTRSFVRSFATSQATFPLSPSWNLFSVSQYVYIYCLNRLGASHYCLSRLVFSILEKSFWWTCWGYCTKKTYL